MTNNNNEPVIPIMWTCGECGKHQVEAITEFHESDEQLICGGCLEMTGVAELSQGERDAYFLAMRETRAMETELSA